MVWSPIHHPCGLSMAPSFLRSSVSPTCKIGGVDQKSQSKMSHLTACSLGMEERGVAAGIPLCTFPFKGANATSRLKTVSHQVQLPNEHRQLLTPWVPPLLLPLPGP